MMTSHQVCSSENEANFESLENLLKLTVAKFCEKFLSFINSRIAGAQLERVRGERSPQPFFKNCPNFGKKGPDYGNLWVTFLMRFFKSFQEKKQNFTLRDLSFMWCRQNVYRRAPIPIKFPCPEKFLVTRLNCLFGLIKLCVNSQSLWS